jgi:SAM-dependent methyltransferase
MKDNFSQQASLYARYRPGYPSALFEYILGFVKEKNTAWDCGTGNGQSAKVLSNYFKKVVATDISKNQVDNAYKAPNIFYLIENAGKTSLAAGSVDLVTVAQAIHWFNFDEFYAEVNRVAKPGAVIAVWTYSLLQVSGEIDPIISDYHFTTLEKFWDAERKYVDEKYTGIPFPFVEIETPAFYIGLSWSLEELKGYFNTWSALQKFIAARSFSPVDALIQKIEPHWGGAVNRRISFPVHLRLGIIK